VISKFIVHGFNDHSIEALEDYIVHVAGQNFHEMLDYSASILIKDQLTALGLHYFLKDGLNLLVASMLDHLLDHIVAKYVP